MSRIKSRLSAYRDYLRPLVMEGKLLPSRLRSWKHMEELSCHIR